jgi:hypothetical protein
MKDRTETESPAQLFAEVYANKVWGGDTRTAFYSGAGSHDPILVEAYVRAVTRIVATLPGRRDAVDLWCGDFNVGSRLRHLFDRYVACDVVPALIERNTKAYADVNVEFRCLDIVRDDLPDGNIVAIRQVLQHLGNDDVRSVVAKLEKYEYLVLTEHLPVSRDFPPNLDQPLQAPGWRRERNRATAAPFLEHKAEDAVDVRIRWRDQDDRLQAALSRVSLRRPGPPQASGRALRLPSLQPPSRATGSWR